MLEAVKVHLVFTFIVWDGEASTFAFDMKRKTNECEKKDTSLVNLG